MYRIYPSFFFVFIIIFLTPVHSYAYPSSVEPYGLMQLPGSLPYDCSDCHVYQTGSDKALCSENSGAQPWAPCLNEFGIVYRISGWSTLLEVQDTDGDGKTNDNELNNSAASAGFQEGAESVGCDMLACATNYPTDTRCAISNVLCQSSLDNGPASSGINPTSYNYSFSFSCVLGTSPSPIAIDTSWSDRCLDANECSGNPCDSGICSEMPVGNNWVSPGYSCTCPQGYETTGITCINIDECVQGIDNCQPGTNCSDTQGSFICTPPKNDDPTCFPTLTRNGRIAIICL